MGDNLAFAFRTAEGVYLKKGLSDETTILSKELNPSLGICRSMKFSNDGRLFAYCDSETTTVIKTANGEVAFSHPLAKTSKLMFSPKDSFFVTWEPYVVYGTRKNADGTEKVPEPNLRLFSVATGQKLHQWIVKNQNGWQPHFTADDKTFVLVENSELHFYESNTPDRFNRKATIKGITELAVSPGNDPLIACCVNPKKGEPASVQLRNFHGDLAIISRRTAFNCDHCQLTWNSKGNSVLAQTSVEVDKSGQSYYGTANIYLLTKQADDFQVPLDKPGPVHMLQWSPTGNQFVVSYGFMPSKTVVFNLKATPIWNLGESFRNEVYWNTFGNLLFTCGFGNVAAGKVEVWDAEKQTEVITLEIPNTTYFEVAPDGQHFLTATTAPRLRIDNNYRIWKYTGQLIKDKHMVRGEKHYELLQVLFCPRPGVYSKFAVQKLSEADRKALFSLKHPEANPAHPVTSMQKVGIVSQTSRYVPPALRKANNQNAQPNVPPIAGPKKEVSDAEKKRRTLQKKVNETLSLQKRQQEGAQLEANQLEKIDRLEAMQAELEKLNLQVAEEVALNGGGD